MFILFLLLGILFFEYYLLLFIYLLMLIVRFIFFGKFFGIIFVFVDIEINYCNNILSI